MEEEERIELGKIIDTTKDVKTRRLPDAPDIKELVKASAKERGKWSTLYSNDGTFKARIDKYRENRAAFMREWTAGELLKPQFHAQSAELGTALARAYGFLNDSQTDWSEEVKKRTASGAVEYAEPSIGAGIRSAFPGIIRAAAFAGIQMARLVVSAEQAATVGQVQAAGYIVYSMVQMGLMVYIPIWQSAQQSNAVARQAARGPSEMPDVKSDKRIAEDGSELRLRLLDEVEKDIAIKSTPAKCNEHDITELYTQLVVTHGSGVVRAVRAGMNAASALSGLMSNVGVYMGMGRDWQVGWGVSTTALLVAQPMIYDYLYPSAVAQDQLAKMATQFQIAAVSGIGNFDDTSGQPNFKKLDKFIRGPIKLRLDHFKAALEYDRKVYFTALIAIRSGSNPVDYQRQQEKFSALVDAQARKNYIKEARNLINSETKAVEAILVLYEKNEKNIKAMMASDFKTLFEKDNLPEASAEMLFGALKCAIGHHATERDFRLDDQLSVIKGQTESRVDFASIHQAAQKLGQSLQKGVLGSAGPNLIRSITNLIQGVMIAVEPDKHAELLTVIGASQNVLQILASCGAVCAGMAYQQNVALKNTFRDRDKDKATMQGSGVMKSEHQINVDRVMGRVTTFETLVAPQIPRAHLPDRALSYEADTRFLLDILSHANAFDVGKFFSEKIAKGGKLNFSSLEDVFDSSEKAEEAIRFGLQGFQLPIASGKTPGPGKINFIISPSSTSTSSSANPSGGSS